MRKAFVNALCRLAAQRDDVVLLTGDLGFSVLEGFVEAFPERFFNVGIAEQNMAGLAAGLAMTGKKVFIYSIANFVVTRCLEQIRNDICYHGCNVTVVSVGGGIAYGSQGYTHFGIEDVAFTRVLPNMHVFVPADPHELDLAMGAIAERHGPTYLRLARGGEPFMHAEPFAADAYGRVLPLRKGRRLAFLTSGPVLAEAVDAAERLRSQGIEAGVYSVPLVEPLDTQGIEALARAYDVLITVEEHVPAGGLGGAVAELIAGLDGQRARVVRTGVPHAVTKDIGNQAYIRSNAGIDGATLAETAAAALACSRELQL